ELALFFDWQKFVGKQKPSAVALIADGSIDARHLADQRALERVGQEDRQIEFALAQSRRQLEELPLAGPGLGAAGAIGDQLVGPGHAGIDRLDVSAQQKADLRLRIKVANGA